MSRARIHSLKFHCDIMKLADIRALPCFTEPEAWAVIAAIRQYLLNWKNDSECDGSIDVWFSSYVSVCVRPLAYDVITRKRRGGYSGYGDTLMQAVSTVLETMDRFGVEAP